MTPLLPIQNDAHQALIDDELKAIQECREALEQTLSEEEIKKNKTYLDLLAHQSLLNWEIKLYQEKLQAWQTKVQNRVVNQGIGTGWTSLFTTTLNFRTVLDAMVYSGKQLGKALTQVSTILGTILFPIHFCIESVRSVWELYRLGRERIVARDAHINATIINFSAMVTAILVVALGVTNPFALPIIFMGVMGAGIYKNIMTTRLLNQTIEKEITSINDLKNKMQQLAHSDNTVDQKQYKILNAQVARQTKQLEQLKEQRFQAKRELVFTAISTAAVIMLIVGIVFPPVAFAGLFLFSVAALVNLADAHSNCRMSRAIAKGFNAMGKALSSCGSAIKNGFKNIFQKKIDKSAVAINVNPVVPEQHQSHNISLNPFYSATRSVTRIQPKGTDNNDLKQPLLKEHSSSSLWLTEKKNPVKDDESKLPTSESRPGSSIN